VRLSVPASTSNLGPGFDLLGIALGLWLEVEVEPLDGSGGWVLGALSGTASEWPAGPKNLLLVALEASLGGAEPTAGPRSGRLNVRSEIPLERGLGSSGAAIAAGLLIGHQLRSGSPPSEEQRLALLDLAVSLEGHPDNVAPALLGGAVAALPHPGGTFVTRPELSPEIGFAVAWPEARVSTTDARAVLPEEVPLSDAIENPRRLAALLSGLRDGDPQALELGMQDRLHVHHRLGLIPGGPAALAAARDAGAWAATISGSGSTLLALAPLPARERVAEAMVASFAASGQVATGRVLEVARSAPTVSE